MRKVGRLLGCIGTAPLGFVAWGSMTECAPTSSPVNHPAGTHRRHLARVTAGLPRASGFSDRLMLSML